MGFRQRERAVDERSPKRACARCPPFRGRGCDPADQEGRVFEQVFRAVKRDCYAGLDSVTLRRRVAERVAGVVPFDSYGFGTADPVTGVLSHMVARMPEALALAYIDWLY